ncbi:hypothetical protein CQB05_12110 [Paracidovorax citrulli]|nr:hypothetical protein CQB05_12110 [Paracidovorax citrulli]
MDGEEPKRGLKGWGQDIAATAVKGAIAIPEAAVGLADILTGGRVGKFLENEGGAVGFRPKQTREIVNDWHSDATKEAQRKFQEADGIVDKAVTAVQNPSLVVASVGESIPTMIGGGAIGRGLLAATRLGQMGAKGAALAGAAGEGLTMAGSQAEQIRQETPDGLLTPSQAGLAAATGAVGGAVGAVGGRIAQRLGIGDAETMLAQGRSGMARQFADEAAGAAVNPLQQQAVKSIPRHVIEGAIAEGLLEELPQSVAEQIFQNVALDKPWYDQVDSAIVLGALSGGAMGAGAAGYHAAARPRAAAVGEGDPAAARPAGDEPAAEAPARNPGLERVSEAFAEQLRMLQEQEQGEVLGPQSAPPDGAAALAEQRAAAAAQRQADMEASRAVESPDDEIYQSTGAQVPRSVRMGINPADGPLSTGAAMAVDTGVSDQMQQAAALAQAAEAGEKSGKAQKQEQPARSPLGADPETGEIPGSDDVANWSDAQLSEVFRGAQGRDVRIKLAQELSRRKAARAAEQSTPVKGTTDGPQAQPASTQPPAAAQAPAVAAAGAPAQGTLINGGTTTADAGAQAKTAAGAQAAPESKDQRAQRIDAAGQTWTRLPTVQRQVVAEQLKGLKPVLQKNLAGAKWENLNSDLKRKIADLIAPVQEAAAAPAPAPAAPVAMARGTTFPPLDAQPVPAAAEARVPPKAAGTSARAARAAAAPVSAPTVAQAAAQEAATSLSNDLPEPTEAQKLAGNYRKGHARINGHDISIENPAGTRRRPEWPPLQNHYGYIKGTKGADKDHVDVFMTDRAEDSALPVFVVDQVNKDGSFDEHKVVMGAADEAEARSTYLGNYEKGWTGLGGITQMTQDEFKDWVRDPAKTVKPAAAPAAGDALPTAAAEEAGPAPDKDAETAPAPAPALPASESASAAPPAPPAAAETVPQRMKRAKAEKAAAPATPAAAGEASPAAKPKTVPEKMKDAKAKRESKAVREAREAEERRAAYFAPGNVVRGYGGGFDRVVSYQPADADGRWSVTVREVQKDGSGAWADKAGAVERTHGTEPSKVNYATGPAGRMEVDPAPAPAAASHEPSAPARNRDNARKRGPAESEPLFRRYAQDDLGAGMAAELLRIMGKGDGFSPEARLQAVESIRATVSPIVAAWQNAPEVVVAYDLNDPIIPQRVRDADTRQRSGGAHGAPEGFYFGGKAYLMASRLTTPEDAARVLYHEVAGHHGLRGLFGPELDKILNQVATMRRADVDAKMAEYGMRGVDRISRARAAEEVLAEMAEKNPQLSFVQRAVAAIRNFLREHVPGFGSLRLRDADIIQAYILPARNWVERAAAARERGMGSAAMQYSLAQDEARSGFAAEVRAAITAGLNNDERALRAQVPLGIETPAALEALGVVRKPVVTNRNLLAKMHFEHGVPRADLERLGELLSNPVMVFKSDTQPGRMVVVTSLVVRGNPVVVAVDPNGASNRAEVVYVPSAYPKDNADRTFTRWIRDGLLQFANKKKAGNSPRRPGSNCLGWYSEFPASAPIIKLRPICRKLGPVRM